MRIIRWRLQISRANKGSAVKYHWESLVENKYSNRQNRFSEDATHVFFSMCYIQRLSGVVSSDKNGVSWVKLREKKEQHEVIS